MLLCHNVQLVADLELLMISHDLHQLVEFAKEVKSNMEKIEEGPQSA